MRLSIINGWTGKRRTAIVTINRQNGLDYGYWTDDRSELSSDELLILAETYAADICQYGKDLSSEERWERDNNK